MSAPVDHPGPWAVREVMSMAGARYAQDFTWEVLDARGKHVAECAEREVAHAIAASGPALLAALDAARKAGG